MEEKKLRNRYNSMKQRCYNAKHVGYKNYGGRGIKVCDEWLGNDGFSNFKNWALKNGFQDALQLDRIDNNGNYSPSNCRWVDVKTNMRNKRNNIRINNKTLMEIAEETKINYHALESRYKISGDIVLKEKKCNWCGKKFMQQRYNQEYCSQECKNMQFGVEVEILIRKIRKEKNITLDELSKMTGMSKGHLSKIERREMDPTITSLARIAHALNVDISELYKIIK